MSAILNNAAWCDTVCRGEYSGAGRVSPRHARPYYPNLVTLSPHTTAAEIVAALDGPGPFAVKDSFASLDLAPAGYRILFQAEWIHRAAGAAPDLGWRRLRAGDGESGLPEGVSDREDVAVITGRTAPGAVLFRGHGVVGVTDVAGGGAWAGVLSYAHREMPGLDLVGYERGAGLDAAVAHGFTRSGPLRVWVTGD